MTKATEMTREQLRAEVRQLALTLEDVARGSYYDDEPEQREEYGGDIAAYFSDVLDVDFICGYDGRYRGVRIALALGGPGIFFDTREGWVQGYWGSDFAEYHVQSWAVDAIDEYFSEQWELVH